MMNDQLLTKLNNITKQYYNTDLKKFKEEFIKIWECELDYVYDPNNINTFNAYLVDMFLNFDQSILLDYVDKVSFKDFLASLNLNKYIIKTYAIVDSLDQWNKELLIQIPKPCIIKLTNGTENENIIVLNDNDIQKIDQTIDLFKPYLIPKSTNQITNFFDSWCYALIKPRIIIEQKLGDHDQLVDDYKVFLFDSAAYCMIMNKSKLLNIDINSYNWDWDQLSSNIYDMNTNQSIFDQSLIDFDFSEMLVLSKQIKAYFDQKYPNLFKHLRVDFYYVNNQLYIGEITFNTANGFFTFWDHSDWRMHDLKWGSLIKTK
ncbi:hypothetical protein UDIV_4400 [Ureaplasma diversum NCTC 246]|uniref:Uncharacterized protein n=2 Tax=Ureaplasma diversum TaxID=42094 RepID=A0A084EYA2_9BACT|nr:hypothetical protein UDIV_4400 [Ureaplasma diversum NCTC 246]